MYHIYALYRVLDSWFEAVSDTIGPLSSTHLNFGSIIHYSKQNLAYCSAWHQPLHQCLPLFGGFAAQHTILHIWNYIGALLLAAAHSRHILSWPQAPACSCHWNKDGSVHVWIKRRSDFTEKLHVRFENDIRSINCCWQSNGTQASVKIEKFSLAGRWANWFLSCLPTNPKILLRSAFRSGRLGLTKKSHLGGRPGRWERLLCDSYHTGAEHKRAVTQKKSTQPEWQTEPPIELPNHRWRRAAARECWLNQNCPRNGSSYKFRICIFEQDV